MIYVLYVAQLDDGHSGSNFTGTVTNGTFIPIEINGGHANTFDSMLVIDTRKAGQINCPGTVPNHKLGKYGWQTCDNDPFEQSILSANHWQQEPWISAFPWYKDFCTMASFNGKPCDPEGAYNFSNTSNTLCAALPTGNVVKNIAYVFVQTLASWPARRGCVFPNTSASAGFGCKNMGYDFSYAVPDFNFIGTQENFASRDPGFIGDPLAGNFSIGDKASLLYELLPSFIQIPFGEIGVPSIE
eukprot:COSAG02_NODE_156_length_33065_cov_17.208336_23_plen_243_part_00